MTRGANAKESNLVNSIHKSNKQINKQTKWLQRVQAMPLFVVEANRIQL